MDDVETAQRFEALWAEIDRAAETKEVDQRRTVVEAVTAKLSEETANNPTAPFFFLLGYGWYFHPDRSVSLAIQQRTENALQTALEKDPGYARAHMYLGHNAFDLGRYAEARSHFEKVDLEQLGSYWAMKVREMRVCCAIAIDGLARTMSSLEEYVRTAEQHPPPDVWPTELFKCIDKQQSRLGDLDTERLGRLLERLKRAERLLKS